MDQKDIDTLFTEVDSILEQPNTTYKPLVIEQDNTLTSGIFGVKKKTKFEFNYRQEKRNDDNIIYMCCDKEMIKMAIYYGKQKLKYGIYCRKCKNTLIV
jgi:predicted SprT family Zn-dependent metalloprotease